MSNLSVWHRFTILIKNESVEERVNCNSTKNQDWPYSIYYEIQLKIDQWIRIILSLKINQIWIQEIIYNSMYNSIRLPVDQRTLSVNTTSPPELSWWQTTWGDLFRCPFQHLHILNFNKFNTPSLGRIIVVRHLYVPERLSSCWNDAGQFIATSWLPRRRFSNFSFVEGLPQIDLHRNHHPANQPMTYDIDDAGEDDDYDDVVYPGAFSVAMIRLQPLRYIARHSGEGEIPKSGYWLLNKPDVTQRLVRAAAQQHISNSCVAGLLDKVAR